jgi:hypothetical protein
MALAKKAKIKILFLLVSFCVISGGIILISGYYSASKPVSFIPDISLHKLDSLPQGKNKIILKNPWFVLIADEYGKLAVTTNDEEVIMSGLTYYSSCDGSVDNIELNEISVLLVNDSTILMTGKTSSNVSVTEVFTIHKKIPSLDVRIRTRYNSDIIVKREALIARFVIPPTEIYLKNRKIVTQPFDPEYWLGDQGVRFGKDSRSCLIYHTPYISSLQLDTRKSLLFINLEYYLDHPHINIPFQEDEGGKWTDQSIAFYRNGMERENQFSMYFGNLPKITPRLMLVPEGYLAGYIFTEHADGGNMKTQRAAYFGDENITRVDEAKGGFVGHKIPVTKSVFYIDTINNVPGSSIINNSDSIQYLDFLDQLYSTGLYEICLHTPEDYNSNRESLSKSLKFMNDRFDSKTWIDHGMYKGKMNRESFCCDGLFPSTNYYAADLWKQFDTRFFWNPAVEEIGKSNISPSKRIKEGKFYKAYVEFWKHYISPEELSKMNFFEAFKELIWRYSNKGELNSLLTSKSNSYPTPLIWQHPTRTDNFYSWKTDYEKDYGKLNFKKKEKFLKMEFRQLDTLIYHQGIFLNHGYFVRNRPEHNIFIESDGQIQINPYFDKVLERMADLRDNGRLYITTVRNLLDYLIMLENVTFEYLPDGRINIYNKNDKPIKGLSVIVNARNARLNGKISKIRRLGLDSVIWFDLPEKSKICLRVEI